MKQRMRSVGLLGLGFAALTMSVGCQGSGAFASLQENLRNLNDQQTQIIAKLDALEKKVDAIEIPAAAPGGAAAAKDRKPKGPQPGRPDPSKTYKVAVGDAHAMGPKDAKITIVEWSDFQ